MSFPEIAAAALPADAVMLDVREDDEWAAGHAPGAVHIPFSELAGRLEEIPEFEPLFVVCRVGGRSARVVEYLAANGWDAINVADGMAAWQGAGRPVIDRDDQPGRII